MKTFKLYFLVLCSLFFLANNRIYAQMTIIDRFGNNYTPADLLLPANALPIGYTGTSQTLSVGQVSFLATVGYFNVYYMVPTSTNPGSGFDITDPDYAARRNVIYKVLNDVSNFIYSPLWTTGNKVNILLEDITQVPNVSSNTIGISSAFYIAPKSPNPPTPGGGIATLPSALHGIVDNAVWETIMSGQDAWEGTMIPPVATHNPYAGGPKPYKHGFVAFNFYDPNIVFNTDLTRPPTSGEYDLYTTALHEITHALGFASLINEKGQSKFNFPSQNQYAYFSRFDLRLRTNTTTTIGPTNTLLLVPDPNCNKYNTVFNPVITNAAGATNSNGNLDILEPNPGSVSCALGYDHTVCNTAIKYIGSTNQAVYTPNCYDPASSLSHFEDECWSATPSSANNNLYFLMSNARKQGVMTRSYTPEERLALCDLGYSVNVTFGNVSNVNLNYKDYTTYGQSAYTGLEIAGVNDGVTEDGFFNYVTDLGKPINITDVLNNDYGSDKKISCLELAVGNGTISHVSNSSFTYTPSATQGDEVHILRYVPVNPTTGKEGNITYVFIKVINGDCSACHVASSNMISNSGFESNASGCGIINHSTDDRTAYIGCWTDFTDNTSLSGSCAGTTTHTGGGTNYLQLYGTYGNPGSIVNVLNTPLVSGMTYSLNFYSRCAGGITPCKTNILQVYAAPSLPIAFPWAMIPYISPNLVPIANITLPANPSWNLSSTTTFTLPTVTNPQQYPYLIIAGASGDFDIDDITLTAASAPPKFSKASDLLTYYGQSATGTITTNNIIEIPLGFTVDANLDLNNCPNVQCDLQAEISVNPGITFSITNGTIIRGANCDQSWNGIITTGTAALPSHVVIDHAELRDMTFVAQNHTLCGVQITGNNILSCTNSRFIDNRRGLVFFNTPSANTNVIDNNEFYSENLSLMQSGQFGIVVQDCESLRFGNLSTGAGNKFYDLSTGIGIFGSKSASAASIGSVKIYNADFEHIRGGYYTMTMPYMPNVKPLAGGIYADIEGAAIYGNVNNVSPTINNVDKIVVDYTSGNTHHFFDCDKNIILSGLSADVQHANISGGWGIMCNNAAAGTYNIKNNSILEAITALYIIGNPSSGVVSQNTIGPPTSASFALTIGYTLHPVSLQFIGNPSSLFSVDHNTINLQGLTGYGLEVFNGGSGLQVIGNVMNTTVGLTNATFQNGMYFLNCKQALIAGNHITGPVALTPAGQLKTSYGILMEQSPNCELTCNYLQDVEYGLFADGNCRTNLLNVKNNSFKNHIRGMYFSPWGGIEGSLGDIGDPGHDNNNTFTGTYSGAGGYQVYKYSLCSSPDRNYIHTTVPISASGNNSSCIYLPRYNPGATLPASCISEDYPIANPGGNRVPDSLYAESLASGQITYSVHSEGSEWWDKLILFEQLACDTGIRAGSTVLNAFYQSQLGSDWDYIYRINKQIEALATAPSAGEFGSLYQAVLDTNAAMPLLTAQAINEQAINSLYLKYLIGGIDTLTAQDSVDIAALARACPVEAGSAVYKARSLYAQYQPLLAYNDSSLCDPQNPNARMHKPGNNTISNQYSSLKLYPNPVKSVLNIEYPDAGVLEILDMTCRKVRSIRLNDNSGGKLVVNIGNLPTGVYTCRYIVENHCVKIVKIELHHE